MVSKLASGGVLTASLLSSLLPLGAGMTLDFATVGTMAGGLITAVGMTAYLVHTMHGIKDEMLGHIAEQDDRLQGRLAALDTSHAVLAERVARQDSDVHRRLDFLEQTPSGGVRRKA